MKKYIFIITCLVGSGLTAAKYPPNLQWREISRGTFTIIFPADRWQQAEAALTSAEIAYEKLAAYWHGQPAGRIRIVLNDSTDLANGFATFYPFNLVGINLIEPSPDSELAGSRSWLDLVLTHELTHIFNLNSAAEPFLKARRVFGNLPILFPAVQLPPWVIEGLAVHGESFFTTDGRLNHPPYPLMLAAARRNCLLPNWSRINGLPAAWPGPAAKYLFGAGFMQYLSEKYGADSLRLYLERSTSRLVLFSSGRDFEKTFGQPLGKLWQAYRLDTGPATVGPVPEPLTKNGFLQQYPCPLGEDRLLYYRRDYQGRGEVAVLNLKTGQDEPLFKMDAVNGLSIAENGKKILLSAMDNFHAFNEFSDLYEYDLEKGNLKRLSRGQRLSQPVASIDPLVRSMGSLQMMNNLLDKNGIAIAKKVYEEIYCVQHRDGHYYLALFEAETHRLWVKSRPFAGMAQPAVNPNGQMIAVAVKPDGGPWGIALFWKDGELGRFISVPGSNLSQPRWLSDENLLFISSGKDSSRLASYNLKENAPEPCPGGSCYSCDDSRLAGLQQFAVSNKECEIFFTYYSGRGLEISRLDLAGLLFSPQEFIVASSLPESQAATHKINPRPYRFWRDLLPHYWATAWRMGGDEFQGGITTGGQDALGIHSFSLEGYYGFSSHRGNVLFQYVYDGLFPTLSFSYSDSIEYYRNHDSSLRSQEMKLASYWPLRARRRSQLYGYADLHLERRSLIYESSSHDYRDNYNGIRLGLEFNSAREYYDSISPADGTLLTLQYSIQPSGLGNEFASSSAQADLRHYISLFRPGVLAWHLALAKSWNDPYGFFMGGLEGEAGSSLGRKHPFDLLRGFQTAFDRGKGGYLFNLEYRLPLFKIEKAVLPAVSLDRVFLNTFFDMGRLWHGTYSDLTAYSIGTEAVLRLAFGGAAAIDLSFGAAYGFGPKNSWCIYLRTGRSF